MIWLHGVRKDENVTKLLFEALVAIERRALAGTYYKTLLSRLHVIVYIMVLGSTLIYHVFISNKKCVMPSFRYRDNSVHLYEWSPFWVSIIFITFNKENYHVYCFM